MTIALSSTQDPRSTRSYHACLFPDVTHLNSTPDNAYTLFEKAGISVHCRTRSFGWVFATRMIGIITLLIAIVLANILTHYIANGVFQSGVSFINGNFWLLMLIAAILFIGALFASFPFPFNLPAPIIRAFGSVFCIAFILEAFTWVDGIASTHLYTMFWILSFIIVPLVFLIVLASGYFEIMREIWWHPSAATPAGGQEPAGVGTGSAVPGTQPEGDAKSWEEIGSEFRLMLYDLLHRFRQEIKRKP